MISPSVRGRSTNLSEEGRAAHRAPASNGGRVGIGPRADDVQGGYAPHTPPPCPLRVMIFRLRDEGVEEMVRFSDGE